MAFAQADAEDADGKHSRTITVASAGPSGSIPRDRPKAVKRASRKPTNLDNGKVDGGAADMDI